MSSTLEIPTPDEPLLGPTNAPHFIAEQLKPTKHGLSELDLAKAIQEIETQTQIAGASFLKVHIDDPEFKIITSGLIKVDEDGLLNELQVEFPENSGFFWQLCAAEGSTELAAANLILTFEDLIVSRLRQQWGHKTAAPGTKTRAEFVRELIHETNVKQRLNPPIKFVCPGLHRIEPVELSAKEKKEKLLQTTPGKSASEAKENKEAGPITRGSWAQSLLVAGGWPVSPTNVQAIVGWETAEGGAGPQFKVAGNTANYNPLNTTQPEPGAGNTGSQGNSKSYTSWSQGIEATVTTLKNGKYANIVAALEAGNDAKVVAEAIGRSPWGTNGELVLSAVESASSNGGAEGGIPVLTKSNNASESDVGQLSRGTPENPDEDSWSCITRLASQVNWSVFTDGKNTVFYMNGPDLIHQAPVLEANFADNHIVRLDGHGHKVDEEFGCLIRPLSWSYDNTSFEYRATHKVKGKTQRRSKIAKPQSPAEVRMMMLCGLTEYRAGDVFVFNNCGPISENKGRWIVADATRETMRYPYTKFLLVPPTAPLREPKAEQKTEASGGNGPAIQAFEAASELSSWQLPYVLGGGHSAGSLANVKRGGEGLDCSGSVCWVLSRAGMYSKGAAEGSGELQSFGEAGKGKEMTIWAGPNHVYIEFNIPGHEPAQLNTNVHSPPGPGPRLVTLSQGTSYNGTDGSGSGGPFVARHFPGT